jgi:hypothetical protein
MRVTAIFVLGLGILGLAAAGPAQADTSEDVTYGAGSVVGTILYAPFKTSFCVVGAVTSGLTLPFGGMPTAERVATAACGGTWAITPSVLKGRERVQFVGGSSPASAGAAPPANAGASPPANVKRWEPVTGR